MQRARKIFATVAAICLIAASIGCSETSDETDDGGFEPDYIHVLFDPVEEEIGPTPTDLVRDDETGELDIDIDADEPAAQQAFSRYLNGLDGYPLSTPIRVPVSAPIDDSTINDDVVVVDAGDDRRLDVETRYDESTGELVVEPDEPLQPETTYRVGLRGYHDGPVGAEGEMVVADSLFYLLRAEASLDDHPEAIPGSDADERQQRADKLADLQTELEPVFQAMADRDLPRDQLAVAFEFTTTSEPAVRYDPIGGEVPMPTGLLVDPDTGEIELPIDESMTDEEVSIRKSLSRMDGFSLSGAATVESTHDIAEGQPTDRALRLLKFDEQTDSFREVDDVERGRLDDGKTAWLAPELTLEPETEYVYVVTGDLESTSGRPHRAQPVGAMTRFADPLVDEDDTSNLEMLSDDRARRLESIRQRADAALAHLEENEGLERSDVAAAVPFQTASSTGAMLERRAQLYEQDVPTDVDDVEVTEPWEPSVLFDGIDAVVRGEMTILDHIDPQTGLNLPDDEPVERDVAFTMTLPQPGTTSIDKEVPVVMFGHGLVTSRELVYLIAAELADAGYAAFAVDLPYHGSRAVCLGDDTCRGEATCGDDRRCYDQDGEVVDVTTFQVSSMLSFLEGTDFDDFLHYPITSGQAFIDMENLVGTRDVFAQGLLDLSQALRVIRGDELQEAVLPDPGHNLGDEVLYLGMSLGGILGAGLTATEPKIENFVLNVPGADLPRLIEESATFEGTFETALEERGIEEGSDEYFEFINAARWVFDPIDPLNHAQHAVEDPLEYTDVETGEPIDDRDVRVMIQMAEGDLVVPNIGTERLSKRMNVDIQPYDPSLTDHAFLFDPTSVTGSSRQAREDLLEFYDQR